MARILGNCVEATHNWVLFLLLISPEQWRKISKPITKNNNAKPKQLKIAFDTQVKIITLSHQINDRFISPTNLKPFVSISNDTNKQAQNDINKERNEDVKIDLAEDPHNKRALGARYLCIGVIQVISVDHRVQAFCSDGQCLELKTTRKQLSDEI